MFPSLFHLIGNVLPGLSSNGPVLASHPSSSIVTNHCVSNAQHPQQHPQQVTLNPSTSVLTVPSHACTTTANSQNIGPTQNSIYLSIACGDERTRHRFCLVVQMMCSLLQKNGQSADAINQFTERFKYLKEQADLSPQDEQKFLQALFNFGNTTDAQANNPTTRVQSVQINHNSTLKLNSTSNQALNLERSQNVQEGIVGDNKSVANSVTIPRKRRNSARRVRCGSCEGCANHNRTRDCRACRNCLDQKRYGGPGKLKKACLKRLCLVLSSSNSMPTASNNTTQQSSSLPSSTITTINNPNNLPLDVPLPQHPMPLSALNGALSSGSSLVGQIKRVEVQVHHQPLLQQRQIPEQASAHVNHIQSVNNNDLRQHNTSHHSVVQVQRPGMPNITMAQPSNQVSQV